MVTHTIEEKMNQSLLKEILNYDFETGIFRWKVRPSHHFKTARGYKSFNTQFSGKEAGHVHSFEKYKCISISRKEYKAHRLAWLYVHGSFPKDQIDHINGIRGDNRLCNLREVTNNVNQMNSKVRNDNNSGVIGVCWNTSKHRWVVQISNNSKRKTLGYFKDLFEAVCIRKSAEKKLGYHSNHGRRL